MAKFRSTRHNITIQQNGLPNDPVVIVKNKDTVTWTNNSGRDLSPLLLPECLDVDGTVHSFKNGQTTATYTVKAHKERSFRYVYLDLGRQKLREGKLEVEGKTELPDDASKHVVITIQNDGELKAVGPKVWRADSVSWRNEHAEPVEWLELPECIDPEKTKIKILSGATSAAFSLLSTSKKTNGYRYNKPGTSNAELEALEVRTGTIDVEDGNPIMVRKKARAATAE